MESAQYFEYLQSINWTGKVYRRFWLYPRLSQILNGRVLDIGCGIGDFLAFRENTIGVDTNPEAVQWCINRGLNVRHMKPNQLPFNPGEFEGAIMDNVLEHLENPLPLLKAAYDVLKGRGRLVVGVPGSCGFKKDADHKIFYSEKELVQTVTGCGFILNKIVRMPFNLRWLDSRLSQYCVYGLFMKNDSIII